MAQSRSTAKSKFYRARRVRTRALAVELGITAGEVIADAAAQIAAQAQDNAEYLAAVASAGEEGEAWAWSTSAWSPDTDSWKVGEDWGGAPNSAGSEAWRSW
ncbi:hypothetical protein B0H17DRAFT_1195309 [Mycena rosella]|uniref:Uncharacterized protein n=1 Tax=Mycena rosella TaxID=1033263 RepID=A0AAD7DXG1_MYCRO|nr:hypothetical protein B0H17DRAFT_1195309 [Mycena rosella]